MNVWLSPDSSLFRPGCQANFDTNLRTFNVKILHQGCIIFVFRAACLGVQTGKMVESKISTMNTIFCQDELQ